MIDPTQWIRLAEIGARKAHAQTCDFEDVVGEALVDFSANPPTEEPMAVHRAYCRSVDYLRRKYGRQKVLGPRGRAAVELAEADTNGAYLLQGAYDEGFAAVEAIDTLERAGLTTAQLAAVAGRIAGYSGQEMGDMRGCGRTASARLLCEARAKLTFAS